MNLSTNLRQDEEVKSVSGYSSYSGDAADRKSAQSLQSEGVNSALSR